MARIRTIKPEFWQDERLATLPRDTRMLFIGLWNLADDHGRLRGHPSFIQGQVFPYDHDIDIPNSLEQLELAGRIVQYRRDGQRFIWIRKFSEHQKMDKRTDSKLPEPTAQETECPAEKLAEPAEKGALEWKGREGKGKEQGKEPEAAADAAPSLSGVQAPESLGQLAQVTLGRAEALKDLWNHDAHPDLPRWMGMSKTRKAATEARLSEQPSFSYWRGVITQINASAFCRGHNDKGWRASPDWLVQPDTPSKVLEGKYDRATGATGKGRATDSDKDWSGFAPSQDSDELFEETA